MIKIILHCNFNYYCNMCPLRIVKVWIFMAIYTHCFPSYRKRIPNGKNILNPCRSGGLWLGVGHRNSDGGGRLNDFGKDFRAADLQWTESLCKKDSDGDGLTNGEELGDPDCVWVRDEPDPVLPSGQKPTHPGVCDDIYESKCIQKNFWFDVTTCSPITPNDTSSTRIDASSTLVPTTSNDKSTTKVNTSSTLVPTTAKDIITNKGDTSSTLVPATANDISTNKGDTSSTLVPATANDISTTKVDTSSTLVPTTVTGTITNKDDSTLSSESTNTPSLKTTEQTTGSTPNNLSSKSLENATTHLTTIDQESTTTAINQASSASAPSTNTDGDTSMVNTQDTSNGPLSSSPITIEDTVDVTRSEPSSHVTPTEGVSTQVTSKQTSPHTTGKSHQDKCPSDNPVQINYAREDSLKNITKPHTVPGVFHPNRVYIEVRQVDTVIFTYLLNDGTTYEDVQQVHKVDSWTALTSSYEGQVQKVFISMKWDSSSQMEYRNIDIVGCFQEELASDGNLWSLTAYEQNDDQP